ncbi:MFS transporter [Kitasatospora sp. NBC_01287]|uniref:MFS transporter n=1 Tax=Kitasatospora sp. NBC_01287 TaxID=2903573 RepID=UPI002256A676|nr:MFS transporter [Kitasatospora sp. NBC_01287]MCX4747248.1 MFS transporter [Kitasatospora sp. NBC_01287]
MRLINRDFTLLWAGQSVSQTGDYVFDTTLTLWVGTELLRGGALAPLAVSGLLVTVAVATLLVAPIAGVLVDRWDHRRTMLGSDLIRAVLIGAVSVLAFLPKGTLPTGVTVAAVYLAVFLNAAVSQYFNPARFAIIGEVVPAELRTKAAGIGQSTQAIAGIVGPPLAAPLLFTAGVQWALVLNALSYVGSYLLVGAVRTERRTTRESDARASVPAELREGLRLALGNQVVRALLQVIALISVGIGALNTVNVFFLQVNLHSDVKWFGTLETALGLGTLLGAVLATPLQSRLGTRRALPLALVAMGALLLGYARLGAFWPALGLLAVLGVALAVVNAGFAPLLIEATPKEYLGRVFSVINPVQQVANVLGMALAGWLASTALRGFHGEVGGLHLGGYDTVLTGSALLVLAGGAYAVGALWPTAGRAGAGSPGQDGGAGAAVAPEAVP